MPQRPGRILFCTTGILLMRLRRNPRLEGEEKGLRGRGGNGGREEGERRRGKEGGKEGGEGRRGKEGGEEVRIKV